MSLEEDAELRDLVSQTLESKGVLSKIRAELRASVFLALEDQDAFKEKTLINKPLKEFVSSTEGALVASLVREFLEFFGLEFTLAVYDPETQAGKDYECLGRSKLARELKITSGKKIPLLSHILQDIISKNDSKENNIRFSNNKTKEEKQDKNSKYVILTTKADNVINGQSTPSEICANITKDSSISQSAVNNKNVPEKPDSLKLDLNPLSLKPTNSLSSLEGLPPLGIPIERKKMQQTTEVSHDIKAFLNLEQDLQDKCYEEDFHSSTSDKTKGQNHSASGSEVDEEIISTGEDQLNSSFSIGLDENGGEWAGSNNSTEDKNYENIFNL